MKSCNMKPDEFFTSVELTNGFASIARVEKLVCLMQQEQCYFNKITAEATKCWSTITRILAATENIDCLRQFIKLGGLYYLGEWLQEAHQCNVDADDKPLEEAISMVLSALVKLPIDQEDMKGYGIGNTVKCLCFQRNMEIQEKAKELSKVWHIFIDANSNSDKISNGSCHSSEHGRCAAEDKELMNVGRTNSPFKGTPSEGCTKTDAHDCKPQYSSASSSCTLHFESANETKEVLVTTSSRRRSSMEAEVPKQSFEGTGSTTEHFFMNETGVDAGMSSKPVESEMLGAVDRKESAVNNSAGSAVIMDATDRQTIHSSCYSKTVVLAVSSLKDSSQKTSFEAESCSNVKKRKEKIDSVNFSSTCKLQEYPRKKLVLHLADDGSLDYWKRIMEQKPLNQKGLCTTSMFLENASAPLHGKQDNTGEISQHVKISGTDGACRGMKEEEDSSIENKTGHKNEELLTVKQDDMELTCDPDDALEVARLVAKEVQEEVGIYGEASGSSSFVVDRNGDTVSSSTAESRETKKNGCFTRTDEGRQLGTDQDIPDNCCSSKEAMDDKMSAGNKISYLVVKDPSKEIFPLVPKFDYLVHEQEPSQLMTVAEDQVVTNQTYRCSIDLNEDVQIEEPEFPEHMAPAVVSPCREINLSTPTPILATSRRSACLPPLPLHFEGELGWKGCAATSAFRQASFCKAANKEKTYSIAEHNSISKQSQGSCGIDLNVANAADDSFIELFQGKNAHFSSVQPFGNSAVEVGSRKIERLNLDLNCLGDSEGNCPDLQLDRRKESGLNPSRDWACSSSLTSISRPSVRDFDLNDNLFFGEAHDCRTPLQVTIPLKNGIADDPVDSISRSTMHQVHNDKPSARRTDLGLVQDYGPGRGRKDFLCPAQPFPLGGPNVFPSVDHLGRMVAMQPALAYTPSPAFAYNRFGMGPAIPLPTVYPPGVVPYMVDSRGTTLIPQQMLASSTFSPLPGTPYLMDVTRVPGINDIGMVRPSFDLNAGGVTSLDIEPRRGNVRHLFFPANNSSMEEQMKSCQQMPMSGPSTMKKEPEYGWETCKSAYKQVTSWH